MSDKPGKTRQDPWIIAGSQQSQSTSRDKVSSRDLDVLIADLGSRHARASTVDPSHRPEQPLNPYPHRTNATPVTPTPNPDDPIQTAFQRKMLDAFKAKGRWGLVCSVYEEAKAKQRSTATKGAAWQYLVDDHENGDHYMYQLACMLPDVVIESLIRNTLPSDYASNSSKALKSFVDYHMNPVVSYAGIYLNITTRAGRIGYKQLPNQQPSANLMGKWLSSNEVTQMLDRVEMYIGNRKTDEWENTALDNHFLKTSPTTTATSKRRFEWKKEDRIGGWVTEVRRLYCTNIAPADADKPFLRCPSEVGFTGNIPKRLADHVGNASTTPIFGLVNGITQQPASFRGFDFPTPWGVVVWPLWLRDQRLARVAEAFGHVLCSSYWHEGGFNFHGAGYSTIQSKTPVYEDILWSNSIKAAGKRIDELQLLDVELEKASSSKAKVECLVRLKKSMASHDEAQKKADESAKKLEDARLPLREETSKKRDLLHEVDTQRQSIRTQVNYIECDYVTKLFERKDKFKMMIDQKGSEVRENLVQARKSWLTICSYHRRSIRSSYRKQRGRRQG